MANQIILCPPSVLAALEDKISCRKPEPGLLNFHPLGTYKSTRSYAVRAADPRLWLSSTRGQGYEAFVLLLTADEQPAPARQPMPLPEALVLEFLDRAVPELSAIAELQGHDLLELAAAVADAKQAHNQVPLMRPERPATTPYEERLHTAALSAELRHAARLAHFDQGYAVLRDRALNSGLTSMLRNLGTQGAVADALDLTPGKRPHQFTMSDDHDLIGLFRHRRLAAADCRALDVVRLATWDHDIHGANTLTPDTFRWIYQLAEQLAARPLSHFHWRSTEDAFGSDIRPAVPVEEIVTELEQFCAAFDRRLMAGVHPIIRAALGLYEMIRIQPFPRDNARMARLVFMTLLDSLGFWALPTPLALHRQRHALATMLEGTAAIGSPDRLIDFMMTVCEEALTAGARMLKDIDAEGRRLRNALTSCGVAAEEADRTKLELLANVFVNVEHDSDYWDAALQQDAALLHELGLVDHLRLGWKTYWSSPVVRELATYRPMPIKKPK